MSVGKEYRVESGAIEGPLCETWFADGQAVRLDAMLVRDNRAYFWCRGPGGRQGGVTLSPHRIGGWCSYLCFALMLVFSQASADAMHACKDGADNFASGDNAESIKSYTLCLEALEPGDERIPLVLNNRGNAYRENGNADQALDDYDDAINLKDDFALAYSNRGLAWSYLGAHTEAIADYNVALSIDPEDGTLFACGGWLGRREANTNEHWTTSAKQ